MALSVSTDFEHAAAEKVRVAESERRVYFAAPLGTSPRGMWFHFKVAGGDGAAVTFVLTNREQMLGPGSYRRAVPVFRHGAGPWRRVDPSTCRVEDNTEVQSFADNRQGRRSQFLFDAPCGPEVTEIAYCYPCTTDMIEAMLARWAARPQVTVQTIGRSEGGRPLRVVRLGTPARGKQAIWVLARQHAGEVPGSFAAEGMVDAVLGRSAWAAALRRRAVVYICPAADIDGIAEGWYGKDRAPVDFNRDWCAFPQRREIAALRKAMDASRQQCGDPAGKGGPDGRMLLVLDLHAPDPGAASFPVPPHPAWAGREMWQRAWWFAKLVERFCPDSAPLRSANSPPDMIDWFYPANGGRNASSFHAAGGLAKFSLTFELTYNWQANDTLVAPDDWRRMGAAMARAMAVIARDEKMAPNVRPPEPPGALSPRWVWLNLPRQCNAVANGDLASIQVDGPQGYAALMFAEPVPVGRGRFAARADIARTSHRKCPMQRLIFFFRNGLFTGEVIEQKGELAGQSEILWRGPAERKHPADSARLGVVLRNWFGTITIGRPARTTDGDA